MECYLVPSLSISTERKIYSDTSLSSKLKFVTRIRFKWLFVTRRTIWLVFFSEFSSFSFNSFVVYTKPFSFPNDSFKNFVTILIHTIFFVVVKCSSIFIWKLEISKKKNFSHLITVYTHAYTTIEWWSRWKSEI